MKRWKNNGCFWSCSCLKRCWRTFYTEIWKELAFSFGRGLGQRNALPKAANPILNSGAPTSTGGVYYTLLLAELDGIHLARSRHKALYGRGWGIDCGSDREIRYTWHLTFVDMKYPPTTLPIDPINKTSPLIIGLDLKKHPITANIERIHWINFVKPEILKMRSFPPYLAADEKGSEGLWIYS